MFPFPKRLLTAFTVVTVCCTLAPESNAAYPFYSWAGYGPSYYGTYYAGYAPYYTSYTSFYGSSFYGSGCCGVTGGWRLASYAPACCGTSACGTSCCGVSSCGTSCWSPCGSCGVGCGSCSFGDCGLACNNCGTDCGTGVAPANSASPSTPSTNPPATPKNEPYRGSDGVETYEPPQTPSRSSQPPPQTQEPQQRSPAERINPAEPSGGGGLFPEAGGFGVDRDTNRVDSRVQRPVTDSEASEAEEQVIQKRAGSAPADIEPSTAEPSAEEPTEAQPADAEDASPEAPTESEVPPPADLPEAESTSDEGPELQINPADLTTGVASGVMPTRTRARYAVRFHAPKVARVDVQPQPTWIAVEQEIRLAVKK